MYRIQSSIMLAITMFLAALLSSGCGSKSLQLNSKWCDREIVIDGKNLEWDGGITYIDDPNVAIGQFNDDTYLYLQLSTWDVPIMSHVMGSGITVWFDPEGGKEKTIGIHYPVGRGESAPPTATELEKGEAAERRDMFSMMGPHMQIMEILPGDDKEPIRISIAEAETLGIEVSVGFNKRTLVYEMKMPLVKDADHPFAIGVEPSKISAPEQVMVIGVGIETPELDMSTFKEGMAGPPPGGDDMGGSMPGGPPGGPPGGGMRPGGGPGAKPEPFSLWLLLSLSPKE